MCWYSLRLFLYLEKSILFPLFLLGIFLLGFFMEFISNKIFSFIRNYFYVCLYTLIYICYILPYFREIQFFHYIYIGMMSIRFLFFSLFRYQFFHFVQYISDFTILSIIIYYYFQEIHFAFFIIIMYIVLSLINYSISKVNFSKFFASMILNIIGMITIFKIIENKNMEKIEENIKKLKKMEEIEKNENKNTGNKYMNDRKFLNNNSILDMYWDKNFENFKIEPIKYQNSFCVRLKKYLDDYLKEKSKPNKKSIIFSLQNDLKNISLKDIKRQLEINYKDSLIDDEIYITKWESSICEKYIKNFLLFENNDSKDLYQPYSVHANNYITIFISGFLTEDKNSFAECFKNYSFKDNKKSDYYFFLWPSCGGIDSEKNIFDIIFQSISLINGIGCKFEEAYKNAEIAGKILSDIIGTNYSDAEIKINLVGHSLGARVVYKCLEYFSENYRDMKTKINDVILLAGATTIDDNKLIKIANEFVKGRFVHCFNKNDRALFISQPFSDSPIGLRKIKNDYKIENYETDLGHTDYCCNLDFILCNVNEMRNESISFY